MSKHIRRFRCPCCRERLELDTRTGEVRRPEDTGAEGLDDLLEAQRGESERLDAMFEGAQDSHKRERERLDRLFREAKQEADDDEDAGRPRNPFDLE
ncbi:MAG: hypothetical protein IPM29_05095 [Planctomycetes bacterium]|nr:hypothetical protein [Planctomycetota bacterium]